MIKTRELSALLLCCFICSLCPVTGYSFGLVGLRSETDDFKLKFGEPTSNDYGSFTVAFSQTAWDFAKNANSSKLLENGSVICEYGVQKFREQYMSFTPCKSISASSEYEICVGDFCSGVMKASKDMMIVDSDRIFSGRMNDCEYITIFNNENGFPNIKANMVRKFIDTSVFRLLPMSYKYELLCFNSTHHIKSQKFQSFSGVQSSDDVVVLKRIMSPDNSMSFLMDEEARKASIINIDSGIITELKVKENLAISDKKIDFDATYILQVVTSDLKAKSSGIFAVPRQSQNRMAFVDRSRMLSGLNMFGHSFNTSSALTQYDSLDRWNEVPISNSFTPKSSFIVNKAQFQRKFENEDDDDDENDNGFAARSFKKAKFDKAQNFHKNNRFRRQDEEVSQSDNADAASVQSDPIVVSPQPAWQISPDVQEPQPLQSSEPEVNNLPTQNQEIVPANIVHPIEEALPNPQSSEAEVQESPIEKRKRLIEEAAEKRRIRKENIKIKKMELARKAAEAKAKRLAKAAEAKALRAQKAAQTKAKIAENRARALAKIAENRAKAQAARQQALENAKNRRLARNRNLNRRDLSEETAEGQRQSQSFENEDNQSWQNYYEMGQNGGEASAYPADYNSEAHQNMYDSENSNGGELYATASMGDDPITPVSSSENGDLESHENQTIMEDNQSAQNPSDMQDLNGSEDQF